MKKINMSAGTLKPQGVFMNKKIIFSMIICLTAIFIFSCNGDNLRGTWVSERYSENWIQFSGKRFSYGSYLFGNGETWLNRRQGGVTDGTYSITDNRIELSFSDGKTEVYHFSRTENTININGSRFSRQK